MKRDNFKLVLNALERQKGDSTFTEYARHLQQYRDWLSEQEVDVWEATPLQIRYMVDDMLDEGYSASTINVRYAALGEFYRTAQLEEYGDDFPDFENPMADAPPLTDWNEIRKEHSAKKRNSKDEVNYLKADEVRRLARNVASPTVRNECMIRLAVATGLRRGELVRLKLSDGTWTAADPETFSEGPPRQIVIRPEVAKNGERRTIGWPKDARLETILKRWIEDYRPTLAKASESEYLFPSNMSEYISGQTFNDVVKEAADNADIQEIYAVNKAGEERQAVTAHVLRHTFAMRCINAGWDIYALSSALGHSSVQVTEESYLHDSKEIVLEHFRDNGPKFGGN